MLYRAMADFILVLHFAFVLFIVLGGVLVLRYSRLLPIHLVAVCWGIVVQWMDWTCPLTPLENHFRLLGGEAGYQGGFVEHFISKILYPDNLTLELRYLLGALLLTANVIMYSFVIAARRRRPA